MGNNDINKDENILIKVDENNLVYIDPNSVISGNTVQYRNVPSENLVVYVNLEAQLIPRTSLAYESSTTGDTITQNLTASTSIAGGSLNFMKNTETGDYDTKWTDSFYPFSQNKDKVETIFNKNDNTSQTFGIDSITMLTRGYTVPQVTINFTDVRGKTLFESPANSPYKAFFHMPWPIYYLTIKGFYGKAIKYRLHLTKFVSRFNEANANFEITCTFIGSTYAFLADIPLVAIMNAPYMYGSQLVTQTVNGTTTQTIKASRSSKGYMYLEEAYNNYKQKGYIAKDFPVKTLREVIILAKNMDQILEREILKGNLRPKIIAGLNQFGTTLNNYLDSIDAWQAKFLSNNTYVNANTGVLFYRLVDTEKNSLQNVTSKSESSLSTIISYYTDLLKKCQIVTQNLSDSTFQSSNFKKEIFSFINNVGDVSNYIDQSKSTGYVWVNIDGLISKINEISSNYNSQVDNFKNKLEEVMNQIIRNKKTGFGFDPTIKNIFAIISANADAFVKLMKDVHINAFDVGNERSKLISNYSDETPGNFNIYPWPQIKISSKNKTEKEFVYPGIKTLRTKLKSDDSKLWPEVEFVEEYLKVAGKKVDNLSSNETSISDTNYIIDGNTEIKSTLPLSTFLNVGTTVPYYDKSMSSIIYEIIERGKSLSFYDDFDNDIIVELANNELKNISNIFFEDATIINTLSKISITKSNIDQSISDLLKSYSQFEKYPYFVDNVDTTDYILSAFNQPFLIDENIGSEKNSDKSSNYPKLLTKIPKYKSPDFRKYIYPFNSDTYLSYLDQTYFDKINNVYKVNPSDLNLSNDFKLDTSENGFINSYKNPSAWYDNTYKTIFDRDLNLGAGQTVNILNTSLFHNQLLYDFLDNKSENGRYAGSSYLFLNSLPFYELQDKINLNGNVRMSSLFKEISATHYVPYHLILKWGSIYHRYKKYIQTGVDILSGSIDNTNKVKLPDFKTMFVDSFQIGDSRTNYSINGHNFNYYNGITTVGIYPYYESIYHQIINDYPHFDINNPSSYQANINAHKIYTSGNTNNGFTYFRTFVDNSQYEGSAEQYYTLLPSTSPNKKLPYIADSNNVQENGFSILWNAEIHTQPLTGLTFPSYQEYNTVHDPTYVNDGTYSLNQNFRQVLDLIGTFSPDILNNFEVLFLSFASERENVEIPQKVFPDYVTTDAKNNTTAHVVSYQNFQELLKDIVTINKLNSDSTNYNSLLSEIIGRQRNNLVNIHNKIISTQNLIKLTLGNPKEYNLPLFERFARNSKPLSESFGIFLPVQIPSQNFDYIKLYCGNDIDGFYNEFFTTMNISYTEDNVLTFRPLILLYAGYRKNNGQANYNLFASYITQNILTPYDSRRQTYFNTLLPSLKTLQYKNDSNKINIQDGYNDETVKLQIYDSLKTLNDKWTAGNSLGQRGFLEEFIFLDRANRDIGNEAFISLEKLITFEKAAKSNLSLFSALSGLLAGSDYNLIGMPAYVNFYGTDFTKGGKLRSSNKVARDVFGTFLEVDYQESTPKILIQYVGTTSKHTSDMAIKDTYFFNDDSFDPAQPDSPLRITNQPKPNNNGIIDESNRVVGFEVNVGDINQSMFKNVTVTQDSIRETSESFEVTEGLGRSETGNSTKALDIGLYNLYRSRSYTCEVTTMGNVMIQPTMYFYLKNLPIFRGAYWITEVSHEIRPNNVTTKFKGVRMNKAALPLPQDTFTTSYKTFYEKILNTKYAKQLQTSLTAPSSEVIVTAKSGSATTDMGANDIKSPVALEKIIPNIGIDTNYGIPYNGYNGEKNIQLISYKNQIYYKAPVVIMGGGTYILDDNIEMSLYNKFDSLTILNTTKAGKIIWSDIKNYSNNLDFYSLRLQPYDQSINSLHIWNNLRDANTIFLNPNAKDSKGNEISYTIQTPNYGINSVVSPKNVSGIINIGPANINYGIGLSKSLMKKLKLKEGDIVYFNLTQ